MDKLRKKPFERVPIVWIGRLILLLCISLPYQIYARTNSGQGKNMDADKNVQGVNQQKIVKGLVVSESGEPLVNAHVSVKGVNMMTITNIDGEFSITVPGENAILIVNYIGYLSKEVMVSSSEMKIVLKEDQKELNDVVVVGYGIQKKESVVGAISQVGTKELLKSGTPNITNAIAGKLSGVLTMQTSGEPGDNDATIVIRGVSSWNGNAPLVLVDGVERSFSDLDPNDVNTVSVLKDASATAVFGAKGANGVIIVTTKRGAVGKPKMDYNFSYGMQTPTNMGEFIDSYTTVNMLNVAYKNEGLFSNVISQDIVEEYRNPSSLLNSILYPNVDWFDLVTKDFASVVNGSVSITGGTDFVKYYCSLGYLNEGSIFKGVKDGYYDTNLKNQKVTYRTNLDFNLSKTSLLTMSVGGDIQFLNSPSSGSNVNESWTYVFAMSPFEFPAYYPAWLLEQYPDLNYPDATGDRFAYTSNITGSSNPYTDLHQKRFSKQTTSNLYTDLQFNQKLDKIVKGLSASAKVSFNTSYENNTLNSNSNVTPIYIFDATKIGTDENPWIRATPAETDEVWTNNPDDISVGSLGDYSRNLYYEASLNYQNTFGNHTVSALALMNRSEKYEGTDFGYYNESWVGRVTYDFGHRYLAEFNVGYTGSERFAPANRFGFFPSGAIGWVVSEENFFKEAVPWMNKLKFRYSDGLVGSDAASERWLYTSELFQDAYGIYYSKQGNSTAQWEEAHKRDIGAEIGLFDDLITLSVDFFDEYRDKMLLTPKGVTMFVATDFKQLNLGSLKKHGFEVEAGFKKTTAMNLYYYLKGIFGFSENRILFKDDLPYAAEYQKEAGKALEAYTTGASLTGSGYYTSVDDIHNNPSAVTVDKLVIGDYKYLDYCADGTINSNDLHTLDGSIYPPITYSLSGGFSYKNFDFNFLFQGDYGKYVKYNQAYEAEFYRDYKSVHQSALDYWTPTNLDAMHSTLHYSSTTTFTNTAWMGSASIEDRNWRKADYLRLKEVYVGYNINSSKLKDNFGISNVVVYASGNNLATWTNLLEGDPEKTSFSSGYYPLMLTGTIGLKVTF